ncbi:MAG: SusC/RagA family TonB-linked outer membrane protein [Flavobacteriaceae bacterium]|nr:SusC/RagA family TonB-linked outer membrane protein [Flavobacteriaceae bacterium]
MKTKFSGILTLLLALVVQFTFAQGKAVSGNISDESGMPVAGVNIIVQGTSNGTQSDFDGNYSIMTDEGAVLTFTYVGYSTVSLTVGSSDTANVTMSESIAELDEVVVTAFGVSREKKSLGYAVSEVSGEEMEQRSEGDVARVLSGKASGVNITSQSGTSGSATNVVIRGYSSINGNNQALFVVDGVPFSSETNAQGGFVSGNIGSSRFLDLDPNNIASVNVLKGLAAATLYGEAGKNGVIVITTKSGSIAPKGPKKTEITINQSYFVNEIASMPDYQNKYGNGFDQSFDWFFSNWGPSFDAGGVDGYLNDPAGTIADDGTVEHPYGSSSFLNNFLGGNNIFNNQYTGERYAWRPYESVENFFRSGGISNTSVNMRGSSDDGKVSYNFNYGHLDEEGFTPGNGLRRNNISIGGRAEMSNKFTISGSLNFTNNNVTSPPVAASAGDGDIGWSTFGNVFFTPRSVDLVGLPFELPETGGSIYYRNGNDIINPYWSIKNSPRGQVTNRVFGTAQLNYAINDNLSATYRFGLDWYNERNSAASNKNGVMFTEAIQGFLDTWDNNVSVQNHYVGINGSYELSEELGLTFSVGAESKSRVYDRNGVSSSGQIVFGIQRHFNYENQTPIAYYGRRNTQGVFGQVDLDYNDYLYLSLSARNDWVSNLPSENNSMFYPSASLSFIATDAFEDLKSESLSYLKVRAGFGSSASFPTGYPTVNTVSQSTNQNGGALGGIITNSVSNFQANPELKPELLGELEFGVDARFANNSIGLNASVYNRKTTDMIVFKPLPTSTGFTQTQDNIGEVQSDGVEIDLDFEMFELLPVDTDGLSWNARVNFTKSKSEVTQQDDVQINYGGGVVALNSAIEGFPLGVITGARIERDANGNFVVNGTGNYGEQFEMYIDDNGNEVPAGTEGAREILPVIGNPEPDYVMNVINTLQYKNFTLGFQFNHVSGGDIVSMTTATLLGRGNVREDRRETFILPGVLADGSPNNLQINNSSFYFNNILGGPGETKVFDGSVVRLQELSLSYSFPQDFLDKTPFGALSLTATGFNLWYDAYNMPEEINFDPNVAGTGVGNARGFDFINGPSTKRYGISLKASF